MGLIAAAGSERSRDPIKGLDRLRGRLVGVGDHCERDAGAGGATGSGGTPSTGGQTGTGGTPPGGTCGGQVCQPCGLGNVVCCNLAGKCGCFYVWCV